MPLQKLVFGGHALPAASVTDDLLLVKDRGSGRRWFATEPAGAWRSFAEADLWSKTAIEEILHRYGDPYEGLPDTWPLPHWRQLQEMLRNAAQGWEDEEEDGVSRLSRDTSRLQRARFFLAENERLPGRDHTMTLLNVRVVISSETGGPAWLAKSLSAFWMASATAMLDAKTPLRRCAQCGHWTNASHAATRYCSAACRNAAHRQKEGK
jgi:NADH pyrophosphatase NudC (nudix superfamily)